MGCLKKEVYFLSEEEKATKAEAERLAMEASEKEAAGQGKKKKQTGKAKPDKEAKQLGEGGMMQGKDTLLPVEWPPRKRGPPIVTVGSIVKSCASRRGLYWCFNGTAGSESVGNLVRHEVVQDAVNAERERMRKTSLKLAQKQRQADKKKLAADAKVKCTLYG